MAGIKTNLLDAEIQLVASSTSNIGSFITGSNAAKKGMSIENTPTDGSNALLKGDKILVPAGDEFDKYFFVLQPTATGTRQPRPTAGIVCQVERDGKEFAMRVFSATFTRRVLKYKKGADGTPEALGKFTEDNACDWPGKELAHDDKNAADLVRSERASLYAALKQLAGHELTVVERRDPVTLGFSNDVDANGNRVRVLREQKVLDIAITA